MYLFFSLVKIGARLVLPVKPLRTTGWWLDVAILCFATTTSTSIVIVMIVTSYHINKGNIRRSGNNFLCLLNICLCWMDLEREDKIASRQQEKCDIKVNKLCQLCQPRKSIYKKIPGQRGKCVKNAQRKTASFHFKSPVRPSNPFCFPFPFFPSLICTNDSFPLVILVFWIKCI